MKIHRKISTILVTAASTLFLMAQSPAAGTLGLKDAEMTVKLLSPISTKTSQKGDQFSAQVITPEKYQGTALEGKVQSVTRAHGSEKAEISFAFETITVGGVTHPIQAELKDVTNSHGVKNVDEEGRAIGTSSSKKKVAGAAIGAGVGGILGGALGGARGAAIGAGAGAGAGLLFAIKFTTSGTDMEFAPGSQFVLDVSDRGQR